MEVIVNNHTPLTVKDMDGNVLFQWQPHKDYVLKTTIKLSDEEKRKLIEQFKNASVRPIHSNDTVVPSEHVRNSIQDAIG